MTTLDGQDQPAPGPIRFRRISGGGGTPERPIWDRIVQRLETILLFVALLAFFGITGISPDGPPERLGSSNFANTLAMTILLAATVPMILVYWRKALPLVQHSPVLLAFLILAAASIYWSEYPSLTMRRVGTLMVPVCCALVLAMRHDLNDVLVTLSRMFLALAAASFVTAVLFPHLGVMSGHTYSTGEPDLNGAWKGITAHKNTLGYIVSLGAQIFIWRLFAEPKRRFFHLLVVIFLMFICVKARSATALMAILFTFVPLLIFSARRLPGTLRIVPEALIVIAICATLLLLPTIGAIVTGLLGKDPTLTGRLPLWHELMFYVHQKPWLGYGYGGFWVDGSPELTRLIEIIQWPAPNAHNAYLELILTVGYIGAAIGTAFLLSVIVRAYRLARRGPEIAAPSWTSYVAAFSIVYAATCMVDTMLLRSGDIYTFILILGHFALVKLKLAQPTLEATNPGPQRQFLAIESSQTRPAGRRQSLG